MQKILILASNPRGDLNIDREIRDLKAAIKRNKDFIVEIEPAVQSKDVQKHFHEYRPYLVHFCGHGAGDEGLVLEGDKLLSNNALSGLFDIFGEEIECVLLNACTTEIQAGVIGKYVPYVIGTSREILDRAAYLFAVGFYEALGYGESIERCHQLGCNAVEIGLNQVKLLPEISETSRKFEVIDLDETQAKTEPLKIILKKNSNLSNSDLLTNIPPKFPETILEEVNRKDYYDNLRDVLERFGQNTIQRQEPKSKSEYEQRKFEDKQRDTLLTKVKDFWLEGFLKPSLYFNSAIDKNTAPPSGQTLRPLTNLEVIPIDIDESYDELQQTDIMGQIGDGNTLLILGEPGSGKTIALLQLAERLIELTQHNENRTKPIPVVFNLSSWGKKPRALEEWLIEELKDQYQVPKTWSEHWLEQEQLILLLDGLDEVGLNELDEVRAKQQNACIRAINRFVAKHSATEIVVCSRVEDYKALNERLLLNSAICIQPLSKKDLEEFLENADDSLSGLKTVIEDDREIAEFAQTPLILNMMTWTYQGWSPERCKKEFRIAKDRCHNLFESYIEKNLERENQEDKYSQDEILSWLSWLARKMIDESKTIFLLEKMQPTLFQSPSERRAYRIRNFILGALGGALMGGLLIGLPIAMLSEIPQSQERIGRVQWWIGGGLSGGLIGGLNGGLIAGLSKEITLFEQMSWSWQRAKSRIFREVTPKMIVGLIFGLIFGLIASENIFEIIYENIYNLIAKNVGQNHLLIAGLIGALSGGLIGALNSGFVSTEVKQRTLPNQGIWNSKNNFIKLSLYGFWILGVIGALMGNLKGVVMAGVAGGPIFGLFHGGTTCIQHFNLRRILYHKGCIPWNYAKFLDYASERLLMKKVGGGYIFYHRMLMEHFAQRYPE